MPASRYGIPGPARDGRGRRNETTGWLAALVFAMLAVPLRAGADDAAREFSTSNLAGNRWTYGWTPVRGGAFTLYGTYGTTPQGLTNWSTSGNRGGVFYNPTLSAPFNIPSGTLALQSGSPAACAVVRYTAQFAGKFSIRARFTDRNTGFGSAEVAVLNGAQTVFAAWLDPLTLGNTTSMSVTLQLDAGETVDFVVGPADEFSEYVGLDATVNLVPPLLGPAGPVFTFGGERFVPCRWPGKSTESLAFDPVNRRLAASGDLSSLCGDRISDGPDEAPGLAWDMVTQTYWRITTDRVVERWSAAGALLDTAFTIPLTFTVPLAGLDTLESVRGIAVDSNYVYVVDAGPNPGAITSNAWFKFTRAGSPVKSSRTTDFLAHLDADPDALVDDIVYVPFSSPFMSGRLLIALEHSGIQAIDTDGNYVDRFRWSTQYLTPLSAIRSAGRLAAFAGLTVDPATGNLYLVDNDAGHAQVWTRVADPGSTSLVIGVVGNGVAGVLQRPNPGCNLTLWGTITGGSPSNLFGAALRGNDHSIYSCDFGNGELWRFDARTGDGARVGHTGVAGVWGVAYDTERDVLYGAAEQTSGRRIVTIHPVTGAAAPLPQSSPYLTTDIAFNPADRFLYAIAAGAPSQLVRIDRNTGAGAVVGNTVPAQGIEYDPQSGKLIASSNSGRLFRIDPATGAAETLAVLPRNSGWEGLAIVTLPPNPGVVAVGGTGAGEPAGLRAWPNPSRASATIAFALPAAGDVAVRVFDVAGRLVREVVRRRFVAGRHEIEWDGRDAGGTAVASGIYFVRVEAGGHAEVARLTKVR